MFHCSLTWPFCTLACRLDGAAGGLVTVTLAWAFRPLAETFTWTLPVPLAGAVYSPVLLMVPPPPLTCQVKTGGEAIAWPNWSTATAVNCCGAPFFSDTLAGVMLRLLGVCTTLAVTLLADDRPSVSWTVTRKV